MKNSKAIVGLAMLMLALSAPTYAKPGTISTTKSGTISTTRTGTISTTATGSVSAGRAGIISTTRTGLISTTRGESSLALQPLMQILLTVFSPW